MPIKCCVQGCKSRYGEVKLSFHRFPAPCTVRDALRRQLWVKATAINSRNVNRRFVCGRHFVTGKPAAFSAVNEPDWIPTLFLYECSEDVSTNETAPEIEDSSLIQVVDRRLSLKRKSLAGSLHGNNTKRIKT
ncbi:uncharacterized protein LOC128737906 isoform X2 [Sabethes cyaneus]|uniref:uncharacterized protein LOC128737906 isoform X2 n=1 Tax=Sabethes cyaneus TaxID=53552 RepID=UPI00237DF2C7|nr:uncharacterized protein LOC128737906 isoform X2 [Sabethes cyaneus]